MYNLSLNQQYSMQTLCIDVPLSVKENSLNYVNIKIKFAGREMNELLQKHGCSNVFSIPAGLKELMSDIAREVLREQPPAILDFITNYLSALLITREHGILAVRILDDLCDCKPSVSEHLLQLGLNRDEADVLSQIIKEEVEGFEPVEGKEKVKEIQILKKILTRTTLDEEMSAKVCQVARNAYRDYWYRKKLMEKQLATHAEEPWEIAANRTLELYKRTKPSYSELTRATQKIQAAYRGYHIRRNILRHLKPKKKKKSGPKAELSGPPLDIAGSREINLGPVIDIKVKEDDVAGMFDELCGAQLGLDYDPTKTITHVEDDTVLKDNALQSIKSAKFQGKSGTISTKSLILDEDKSKSELNGEGVVRQFRLPSQVGAKQRESRTISIAPEIGLPSRLPSQIQEAGRQSRLESQMAQSHQSRNIVTAEDLPRISFSDAKVIIGDTEDSQEVPEELHVETAADVELDDVTQAVQIEVDITEEISEDVEDDRTEGDGESAPTASVPTTTGETADETDVEDAEEEMATTEDEQQ